MMNYKGYGKKSPWAKPVSVRLVGEEREFFEALKSMYDMTDSEAMKFVVRELRLTHEYKVNPKKKGDHGKNTSK